MRERYIVDNCIGRIGCQIESRHDRFPISPKGKADSIPAIAEKWLDRQEYFPLHAFGER